MQRVNAFGRICLSVCLFMSVLLGLALIYKLHFGTSLNIYVNFLYQGHGVKVKVTRK